MLPGQSAAEKSGNCKRGAAAIKAERAVEVWADGLAGGPAKRAVPERANARTAVAFDCRTFMDAIPPDRFTIWRLPGQSRPFLASRAAQAPRPEQTPALAKRALPGCRESHRQFSR